jgi:hypothetical protein
LEATFFVARREDATGVACVDDLPVDPAGDSLRIGSLAWIRALPPLLGLGEETALQPLRDATCQSFPVFGLSREVGTRLAALTDDGLDDVAARWRAAEGGPDLDADLHELCELLVGLREALRDRAEGDEGLYVLLEEKAL